MAKLRDYIEGQHLINYDESIFDKEINFDLYENVRQMSQDTCLLIADDACFCDAEWNLFQEWYKERGFTEEEWEYVEACGYERDQFEKE